MGFSTNAIGAWMPEGVVNDVLEDLSVEFERFYTHGDRLGIAPERPLGATPVQELSAIRSARDAAMSATPRG
jgi:hypothetical protein